ncbi:unnamed protein product, partial [Symbiodinium sp. CCMP2456]
HCLPTQRFLRLECVETSVGIASFNNRRLQVLKSFAEATRDDIKVCCKVKVLDPDCESILDTVYDGRRSRARMTRQLNLMRNVLFHRDSSYPKTIRVRRRGWGTLGPFAASARRRFRRR